MPFSAKRTFTVSIATFIFLALAYIWWSQIHPRAGDLPLANSSSNALDKESKNIPLLTSIAARLEIPWALDFLPDGSIVFTERPGRIRLIKAGSGLMSQALITIKDVAHIGEGGLLGIATHPDFINNHFIYVYYTYKSGKSSANCVARYTIRNDQLVGKKTIIDNIPAASNHNGGRIKFGPDGYLYITCGDAMAPELAQDKSSLAGKILRIKDNGQVPDDNPFPESPVYSMGHRNPQGLAWDSKGRLWATEHGSTATDEINLIEAGKNYGWPIIRGNEKSNGLEQPVIHSGRKTWAPSGIVFFEGALFFTGLRGQSLYKLSITQRPFFLNSYLHKKLGRLREVVAGPDGFLYLMTNNRDGRGIPTISDDRIVRVNPKKL